MNDQQIQAILGLIPSTGDAIDICRQRFELTKAIVAAWIGNPALSMHYQEIAKLAVGLADSILAELYPSSKHD